MPSCTVMRKREHLASGLAERGIASLARSLAEAGPTVLNPARRTRPGVVELVVGAEEPPGPDVQVLSEHTGPRGLRELQADTVRSLLGMLQGPQIDRDMWLQDIVVEEDEDGIGITFAVGPEERPGVAIARAQAGHLCRLTCCPTP